MSGFEYEWEKPKPADCADCAKVRAQSAGAHRQCAACEAKDYMQSTEAERQQKRIDEWHRLQDEGFIRKDLACPYREP